MTRPEPIRVLLVDDESVLRKSIRRLLKHVFDFTEAADGAEAIELLRAHRFDVVVTDLDMPKVDGQALVAWIDKYQPALSNHVVILTGGPHNAARKRWLDAFDDERVLFKPCSITNISEAIERVSRRGKP